MRDADEDYSNVTVHASHAIGEFARVLWHLRSVMFFLLAIFVALSIAMRYGGGAVDSATHEPASLGHVVYFCAITALTIGYGDVVPSTDFGRVLSVLLGLLGVLIMGLVTAAAVYGIQAAAHHAGIRPR